MLLALNDAERYDFDYFVRETAGPVQEISPAKGWVQLALQLSN